MVGLVALAYLTVEGASPVEQIEAAASAGFGAVGLRFAGPADRPLAHPVIGHRVQIREIRTACDQTGVAVFDVEMVVLDNRFRPIDALPIVEAAAEVGAEFLQVVSEDSDRGRAADNLALLGALAEAHRLELALEFMPFRSIRTMSEAADVIATGGSSNARIVIDALHFQRSGGSPTDLEDLETDHIAYVQLCDAPARSPSPDRLLDEARSGRLYPGQGDLPLADLLASLPGSMPVSLEVPRPFTGETTSLRARRCADATRRFFKDNAIDATSFTASPVTSDGIPPS